jgi:hypothetical protein
VLCRGRGFGGTLTRTLTHATLQAGALRDSLRTSTGHMRPGKPTDRRRKGVGADAADGDEDDFDALVRVVRRPPLACCTF